MKGPNLRIVAALFAAAAGISATAAHAVSISSETLARCFDDNVTQSTQGGPGFPVAMCDYDVNRTGTLLGLKDRVGTIDASAKTVPGFRSVGVDGTAKVELTKTGLPTVFGAEVRAKAGLTDTFIMDASLPNGTPVSNGFLTINALATGSTQLNVTGAGLSSLSSLELNYLLSVGGSLVAANNIFMFPGEAPINIVQPVVVVIPWQAGAPIDIIMQADAHIDAQLAEVGTIDAKAQFGNSLDWLGITDVTDAFGNPVGTFSAMSADGSIDWGTSQMVPGPGPTLMPEAGALTFAGLGLASLGLGAHRRKAY